MTSFASTEALRKVTDKYPQFLPWCVGARIRSQIHPNVDPWFTGTANQWLDVANQLIEVDRCGCNRMVAGEREHLCDQLGPALRGLPGDL